jgi:cleavage and polyadenylation specificity factor subunit 1
MLSQPLNRFDFLNLDQFGDDAGIGGDNSTDDVSNTLLLCVGTGRLTQDGEDVSSKGRLLLFKVKRPDKESLLASSQVAELSLVYEKEILHGPVSSLSCLASEGRNRLVIGAGADVNVEQWGDGRLTQVGFFRATMQILDISLFRNFFLLSDA